jgi:hypothetical protein
MNEARPYASLSSGLLARKGTAKPAMRPQNYGSLEDLGWNDMGQAPGEQGRPPAPADHVPSSIAALTPAPKIQRTHPTDEHLPPDAEIYEGEEEAAVEGSDEEFAPVAAEPPFEAEPVAGIDAEEFAAEEFGAEEYSAEEYSAEEPLSEEPVAAAHEPVETFEAPPVVEQQRAILEHFDAFEEAEAAPAPAAPRDARADIVSLPQRAAKGDHRKAAFTLRLDAERHLRLRLACAVTRHSAQQIVARALDEALAGIPEIEALASQVPAKPGRAGKR